MWRYIHARTVARLTPRLRKQAPDHGAACQRYLSRAVESQPQFSVLQVGAFDGVSNDPVYELIRTCPHVRAVLLEPQPGPFAELCRLWKDNARVFPIQAALAGECGERPLFVIAADYSHLHPFAGQVASFSRGRVETACRRYVWRPSPAMVTAIMVTTVDWRRLVAEHGPFDLVVIDAEGYDGDILHQMDLSRQPPLLVLYEHCHLSRSMRRRCEDRLQRAGFVVRPVNKSDTLATRLEPPDF
jgi:FkbM family methyltransferase